MSVLSKLFLLGSGCAVALSSGPTGVDAKVAIHTKYSNTHFGQGRKRLMRTEKKQQQKSQAFLGYTTRARSTTPSFYHSSDDISAKLAALVSGGCNGLTVDTKIKNEGTGYDVSIDIATLSRNPEQPKKNKFFILFGEHARELISPESSLHFLESLCGQHADEMDQAKIDAVLAESEFQVIVNGNPNSRRKVEEGDYCLRVNGQGVDLNRNWDEKWIPADQSDSFAPADTNPGPKAFSEPETNIFRVSSKLL